MPTNYLKITSSHQNSAPILASEGTANDVNIIFQSKGSGVFQFESASSSVPASLRLNDSDDSAYIDISAPSAVTIIIH